MPFSMMSYFLGVGTVVGALAFGFGGGVLLTKTAIKDTPTGASRIERAARAEPVPSPQVTEAKAVSQPRAEPTVQASAEPSQPAPAAQPAEDVKPAAEAPRPEPVKVA